MRRYLICILLITMLMLISITIAYADEEGIVITNYAPTSSITIEVEQQTVDIPVILKGLTDVYAFSLSMTFSTNHVQVESISMGDIFSDYGSAVVQNDIDNDAGQATFMQTMLSVDKGVNEAGMLCTIRMTFEDGTYELSDDIQLDVKVANSVPEYMDVHVVPCTIIVDTQAADTEPQPTPPPPIPTATIGVITPDPQSEEADIFEAAEDQSVDEILEQIGEKNSTESASEMDAVLADNAYDDVVESSAQPKIQSTPQPSAQPAVTQPVNESTDYTLLIVLVSVGAVMIVGVIVWYEIRRRKAMRTNSLQEDEDE